MAIAAETRLLALMGDISVTFSNLEAQLAMLLASLIDTSDSFAGSLLADEFTLSRRIKLIRRLAHYRFIHNDAEVARLEDLCKAVDDIRIQRNLFVHGTDFI